MLKNFKKFQVVGEFGASAAIDWGWLLYTRLFGKIAGLVLVVFLPVHIIIQVCYLLLGFENSRLPMGSGAGDIIAFLGLSLLLSVAALLVQMALALIIKGEIDGDQTSLWHYLAKAWSLMGKVVWTEFLIGVALIILLLLLVIPGLIFSVYTAFTVFIVAILGMSGTEAIEYSISLVSGRWWNTFGIILCLGLITLCVSGGINLIIGLFPLGLAGKILTNMVTDFSQMFRAAAMIAVFLNREVQKDWYANRTTSV